MSPSVPGLRAARKLLIVPLVLLALLVVLVDAPASPPSWAGGSTSAGHSDDHKPAGVGDGRKIR